MLGLEHYGCCLVFLSIARLAAGDETVVPYPMSKAELLRAAGYYDEDGAYQGGIPKFRDTLEINLCTSLNATVCNAWEKKEFVTDENYNVCQCTVTGGDIYCAEWICSRVQKNNAQDCEGAACYSVTGVDTTSCKCDAAVKSGDYCVEWWCGESAVDGAYTIDNYKCVVPSASGSYCKGWTRELESDADLEVAACECTKEKGGGCSYWECRERSIDRCGGVCDVRIAVGIGGTLGLIGGVLLFNAMRDGGILCSLILLMFVLAAAASVVYWGGQAGAIYVAIMWGIPLIIKGFCWVCRKKE